MPVVKCRTFEDNKSCIVIATNHKTRPRTKHISVRLHHFRSHIIDENISIEHIFTLKTLPICSLNPLPLINVASFVIT